MKLTIAQLQTRVYADKADNIGQLEKYLNENMTDDVDIVCLPEMFICPYKTSLFPEYAEPEGGESWTHISELAYKYGVYIQAGSVPEIDDEGRIYNTAYMFDRNGRQIGKHRKLHLFDIHAHGQIVFLESDTLTGGDSLGTFDTEWCRMGMSVCFDIRFPEVARIQALEGAKVIFNPGAFNFTTGPAHWELGFRQRSVENQIFMVGTGQSKSPDPGYKSWGHSIVTNPWGEVLSQLDEKEGVAVTEIDLDIVESTRARLPMITGRREDIYKLERL